MSRLRYGSVSGLPAVGDREECVGRGARARMIVDGRAAPRAEHPGDREHREHQVRERKDRHRGLSLEPGARRGRRGRSPVEVLPEDDPDERRPVKPPNELRPAQSMSELRGRRSNLLRVVEDLVEDVAAARTRPTSIQVMNEFSMSSVEAALPGAPRRERVPTRTPVATSRPNG